MDFLPSALRPHGRDRAHDLEKDGIPRSTSPYPPNPPLSRRATVLEPEAMHQLVTHARSYGYEVSANILIVSLALSLYLRGTEGSALRETDTRLCPICLPTKLLSINLQELY